MRFAVISDVQANLLALEAVLGAIDTRHKGVERIISAGDVVGRGPQPNEVIDLFRTRDIESVRGNYDDAVAFERIGSGVDFATAEEEHVDAQALAWTRENLSAENLEYLRGLPHDIRLHPQYRSIRVEKIREDERTKEYRRNFLMRAMFGGLATQRRTPRQSIKQVLVVHGSPRALNEFIREETANSIVATILRDVNTDVLVTGHAAEGFRREATDVTLVGVGGVTGPHRAEGEAHYAVLDVTDGVKADFGTASYDMEAQRHAVRRSGIPTDMAEPSLR
jgi:predicted phosphodiesterase